MAEITFKSAGVKTREIDLSQPSRLGPVGIPAGIIGTSLEGPAFEPHLKVQLLYHLLLQIITIFHYNILI